MHIGVLKLNIRTDKMSQIFKDIVIYSHEKPLHLLQMIYHIFVCQIPGGIIV